MVYSCTYSICESDCLHSAYSVQHVCVSLCAPAHPVVLSAPVVKSNKSHESSPCCFGFCPGVVFLNSLVHQRSSASTFFTVKKEELSKKNKTKQKKLEILSSKDLDFQRGYSWSLFSAGSL